MTNTRVAKSAVRIGVFLVMAAAVQVRADDCDGSKAEDERLCFAPSDKAYSDPNFCLTKIPNEGPATCGLYYDWTSATITPGCTQPGYPKETLCTAIGKATPAGWIPETVRCGTKWQCKVVNGVCTSNGSAAEDEQTLKFSLVLCSNPTPGGVGPPLE